MVFTVMILTQNVQSRFNSIWSRTMVMLKALVMLKAFCQSRNQLIMNAYLKKIWDLVVPKIIMRGPTAYELCKKKQEINRKIDY